MISYASPAFMPRAEGFVGHLNQGFRAEVTSSKGTQAFTNKQGFANPNYKNPHAKPKMPSHPKVVPHHKASPNHKAGFQNYSGNPAGARDAYSPIGAFDGVKMDTGNGVSSWRYTKPNEPLSGNFPKFEPGPDNLFMFKDNQCKPECCGSSFSCDGGCVCTTPEQRDFINHRGGNRTSPESGV